MVNGSEVPGASVSRRTVLRTVVIGAGAVTLLDAGALPASAGKVSQASVAYQNSPKGTQSCANCNVFEPPSSCKTVDGTVAAQGWCKIWQPKKV
jgi:High potential iron-sulfur protein